MLTGTTSGTTDE